MTYARITTIPGTSQLTDDSTCTIGDQTVPVPTRTDTAGRVAPHRVWVALDALGWQPATNYYDDIVHGDGYIDIAVIPA